jgi:hypothetical protein
MTPEELKAKYAKVGKVYNPRRKSETDLSRLRNKAVVSGNIETKPSPSKPVKSSRSAADTVPFGKYRGEKLETLLSDENYVEWILAQPGMVEQWKERNPTFGRLLAEAIGSGAPVRQSRLRLQQLTKVVGEIYEEAKDIDVTTVSPADTEAYRACMDVTRKMRAILESLPIDASEEDELDAVERISCI